MYVWVFVSGRRLARDCELVLHYFEAQATALAEASGNLTEYFLQLAKLVEAHRAKQKALDDQVGLGWPWQHFLALCQ